MGSGRREVEGGWEVGYGRREMQDGRGEVGCKSGDVGGGRGQCAVAGNEVYLWQKLRWHELLGIETHHRQDFRAYRETC